MTLTVKIDKINYGDVAVKAMPILGKAAQNDTAVGKILTAIAQLPQEIIRQVMDAIPQAEKNEIVALLGSENKEWLLGCCTDILNKNGFDMTLQEISVTKDLEIKVSVNKIDYHGLVKKFLPMVKAKMIDYVLSLGWVGKMMALKIKNGSADSVCEILDKFPQKMKDDIINNTLIQNQEKLIAFIEDMARKNGIELKIESFRIEW